MQNLTRRDREKRVREEEIISAAERIFYQKGFEDASMDEIAKEAQFTKRTLYQYFENKEDLYFAVVIKGLKRLLMYLKEAYDNEEKGYTRIKQSFSYYYRFYNETPEIFRIMSYLGHVRKKSKESKKQNEFIQINKEIFQTVSRVIAEGKRDGSIKNELDTEKVALSLIFLMTGFFNQLSATGQSFTEHFSLNIGEFSLFTIDLILGTLKKD